MMIRLLLCLLLIPIVVFPALGATTELQEPDGADTAMPRIRLHRTTLANGLQVVVLPLPEERLVHVDTYYDAGSATDADSVAGLAHFAEHLLMDSTRDYPDGGLQRQLTLHTTRCNAYTGGAYMHFENACLPGFTEKILRLEAARMRGAGTDSVSFEREKRVVLEERSYRTRLTPHRRFLQQLFQGAYPGHPFGRDVGGSAETIRKIGMEHFDDFLTRRIRPDGAVMVVAGPVEAEAILDLARSSFDFGPDAVSSIGSTAGYPAPAAGQWIDDVVDRVGVCVGFACRIPVENGRDTALVTVLEEVLSDSRLNAVAWSVPGEAVLLVYSYWHYYRPPTDPAQQYYIEPRPFNPEQDAQDILGQIWGTIGEALEDLGSEEEFGELRGRILDDLHYGRRGLGLGAAVGSTLISGNEYLPPDSLASVIAGLNGGDIYEFATRHLQPGRAVVGVSHGRDSKRIAAVDLVQRVAPEADVDAASSLERLSQDEIEPVLEAYRAAGLFRFEVTELPNGIPVHSLVIPDAGRWYLGGCRAFAPLKDLRPGKKDGLDYLYNGVVEYGESKRDRETRRLVPQRLPFDFSVYLSPWQLNYTADGPGDCAADVAEVVGGRLGRKDFNTTRWSSLLRAGERNLAQYRRMSANAAQAWRWRQLLGEEHAAPTHWAPDPETAASVKYRDLQKLHGKTAGKIDNTVLVTAGALEPEETVQILAPCFEDRGEHRFASIKPGKLPAPPEIRGRVFPDVEKGDVRLAVSFGVQPIDRTDRTAGTTALLLEKVLRARLLTRLREEAGLTYNVSCQAVPVGGLMLWEVEVTCQPGQAHLAHDGIVEELAAVARDGFSPDEWARARLSLVGSAVAAFSEAESGLQWMLRLAEFGELPRDPMDRIFALEPQEINARVGRLLHAEDLVFTAVGPMFEDDIDQF